MIAGRQPPAERPPTRLPLSGVLLVSLLAVAVRLVVSAATPQSGLFSDMEDYHSRALLLGAGRELPDSYRGPGYPLFLALLYWFPGGDFWAARVGNALLAGLTAAMTAWLASDFVGRRAALGAAAVTALYPASVLSAVYLMPESLYGALLLAGVLVSRRPSGGRAFAAGAIAGLAALTRSVGLALLPAILAARLPRGTDPSRWRTFLRDAGLIVAGCLLALSPWLTHTHRVSGGLMLDSNSGFNFLLGANPRARERLELASYGEYFQSFVVGIPNEAERNRRALAQSWTWIRENPWRWVRLMPRKAAYLYGIEGREHVWLYSNSYFGPRSPTTVKIWAALLIACFPPLAVLAVVGLLRPGLLNIPAGAEIVALIAVTTLLHALSFSETRFHLPLLPFLAVLAARGLVGGATLTRPRMLVAMALVAGLAAGWWSQGPEIIEQLGRITTADGWQAGLAY